MPPRPASLRFALLLVLTLAGVALAQPATAPASHWPQWRGPSRDGLASADSPAWPESLSEDHLRQLWRIPLGPSYSGPVVSDTAVFTTQTLDRKTEVVTALDRNSGKVIWTANWPGSISVPFFAKSRGDWIRATPAFDGQRLYVAGIRDLLVCLDAASGREIWRIDFTALYNTKAPDFGLVCSPLIDAEALYIQAANSVLKINKLNGNIVWRSMENKGAIEESGAFSSPIITTLAGLRQLVVQNRDKLAGIDLESGKVLWSQLVPNFRGMNILTPVVRGDTLFTSSYQNKSWLYRISRDPTNAFKVDQLWTNSAQAYMSTPVVVAGHAYLQLGNQRFTCVNLDTGKRTWTSPEPFGQYASLIAREDRILALDERGLLLLLKANPEKFELLDQRRLSDDDCWAHLAIAGDQIFIRERNALAAYRWQTPTTRPTP